MIGVDLRACIRPVRCRRGCSQQGLVRAIAALRAAVSVTGRLCESRTPIQPRSQAHRPTEEHSSQPGHRDSITSVFSPEPPDHLGKTRCFGKRFPQGAESAGQHAGRRPGEPGHQPVACSGNLSLTTVSRQSLLTVAADSKKLANKKKSRATITGRPGLLCAKKRPRLGGG